MFHRFEQSLSLLCCEHGKEIMFLDLGLLSGLSLLPSRHCASSTLQLTGQGSSLLYSWKHLWYLCDSFTWWFFLDTCVLEGQVHHLWPFLLQAVLVFGFLSSHLVPHHGHSLPVLGLLSSHLGLMLFLFWALLQTSSSILGCFLPESLPRAFLCWCLIMALSDNFCSCTSFGSSWSFHGIISNHFHNLLK